MRPGSSRSAKRCPNFPIRRSSVLSGSIDLSEYDALILTESRELADYFEAAAGRGRTAQKDLQLDDDRAAARAQGSRNRFTAWSRREQLGGLLEMVETGTISGKIAKTVFAEMLVSGKRSADNR